MKGIKIGTNKYFNVKEKVEEEIDLAIKEFKERKPHLKGVQILEEVKKAYTAINEHRKSAGALASILGIGSGLITVAVARTFFDESMEISVDGFLPGLIAFLLYLGLLLVPVVLSLIAFSILDARIRNRVYRLSISLDVIDERIESLKGGKPSNNKPNN